MTKDCKTVRITSPSYVYLVGLQNFFKVTGCNLFVDLLGLQNIAFPHGKSVKHRAPLAEVALACLRNERACLLLADYADSGLEERPTS